MDNAPHHSMKIEKCPILSWKKAEIESWLKSKGEPFDRPVNKVRLMEIVKRSKPQFNKYVVDEHVKYKNITVLRTPPYHTELNPKLWWSFVKRYVKTNNTTFKLPDMKKILIDGVNKCTYSGFVFSIAQLNNFIL